MGIIDNNFETLNMIYLTKHFHHYLFIDHLFLILIDVFLYLCFSGWSVWKHILEIF
jgi:hypothetical protein